MVNVERPETSFILCRDTAPGSDPQAGQTSGDDQAQADPAYHRAREQAERKAADEATSERTRRIHEKLAEAHSKMAEPPGWTKGR